MDLVAANGRPVARPRADGDEFGQAELDAG
jgi:hypothetical protein